MGEYRREVDGLRALAVLAVILYHAGVPWLPGGFLGVDVFFVISGYLISRILLTEMEQGTYSLAGFYERRARRILPALFTVISVTVPFAWFLMPPDSFGIYVDSVPATVLFSSNIFFWNSTGYFMPSAELQPLLHTWSLAVEEQYYLLFPLLFAVAFRLQRKNLAWLFLTLALIGFGTCIGQENASPSTAFFMLHARAWELFAGVLVMLLERQGGDMRALPVAWRQGLATGGLALVVAGFWLIPQQQGLPGLLSLVPVLGTALLLATARPETAVGKALGWAPLVAVGLVSYSAYLWHQPLFAFARLYSINEPGLAVMLPLSALAVALAFLSYRYVERPWRNRKFASRTTVFTSAALCTAVLLAAAGMARFTNAAEARFTPGRLAAIFPAISKVEDCAWEYPDPAERDFSICRFGRKDAAHPLILWGDSHARALFDALDARLLAEGRSGIYVQGDACIRTPGIYRQSGDMEKKRATCGIAQAAAFSFLKEQAPQSILVSMRWTLQMFPVPGSGPHVGFDNGEGGVESETERTMMARTADGQWTVGGEPKALAIRQLVERLAGVAPVVLLGPVPEVGWNVGDTNFKTMEIHGGIPPDISTSITAFETRNSFINGVLASISASGIARIVQPSQLLCNIMLPGRCVAQFKGTAYYGDDDHVSRQGAELLLQQALAAKP